MEETKVEERVEEKENKMGYETGIVKCVCGEVLGNYFTGDFYSLISKKYCD